ncbi:uncharacterized protein G2W53_004693 [Senna tora]|uniref:Uncharacterized protein n=1 Tax=Senna tora TaxID=362788 RepID=A0A834XC32_9FABA|nr:uncharacterized protein G2W53_004693 [Senna tora]
MAAHLQEFLDLQGIRVNRSHGPQSSDTSFGREEDRRESEAGSELREMASDRDQVAPYDGG